MGKPADQSAADRRQTGPLIVTALLVLGGLGLLWWRTVSAPDGNGQAPAAVDRGTPDDCLNALLAAAKAGDAEAYLACFAGPLREQIDADLGGRSPQEQSARLRAAVDGLRAQVTKNVQIDEDGSSELVLERVYSDFTQRMRVRLRKGPDGWAVVAMKSLDRRQPEVPYGMPVYRPPQASEASDGAESRSTDDGE